MKARRLKNLRVKRVDLVAKGANQQADVLLFKSEEPVDMKECKGCGASMKADAESCEKCGAEMKTKAAPAAKEKDMDTETIKKMEADLKAATELAEEESKKRELVEKSLKDQAASLEALKKQFDAQAETIKKAEQAAKLAEFKKSVDAFEHLPVKADVFAPVLMKCAEALDEAGYAELMRVLKAADNASAENFSEIGAPGAGTVTKSATEELHAKAEEIKKGDSSLDINAALAQAAAQNPKLAARARRESYSARQES